MNKKITAKDIELLSSYLDHQLTSHKEKQVQARLSQDIQFKQALSGLRRTKLVLSALPEKPVPHNFSIPNKVNKSRFNFYSYFRVFRFTSVAATFGLIVLVLMDFLGPSLGSVVPSSKQAVLTPAAASDVETMAAQPMVITWATPPPDGEGRGGGEANLAPDLALQGTPSSLTAPMPMASAKEAPQVESTVSPEVKAEPSAEEKTTPITGSGPILGIPPSNERGAQPTVLPAQLKNGPKLQNSRRGLEIGLLILTLLSALLAFLFHRRVV